jgi:hypothetical protein
MHVPGDKPCLVSEVRPSRSPSSLNWKLGEKYAAVSETRARTAVIYGNRRCGVANPPPGDMRSTKAGHGVHDPVGLRGNGLGHACDRPLSQPVGELLAALNNLEQSRCLPAVIINGGGFATCASSHSRGPNETCCPPEGGFLGGF